MALLKIFVSSTCYDLNVVRTQLRSFIQLCGHEPVMSDYNDVLFDPRSHTHESCIKEIGNADMVILIIGSRFGGVAVPKAVSAVDLENLKNASKANKLLENPDKISVTQLEILKAVESDIPIFTFIDSRVMHDHLFYEKNKDKGILDTLEFPSIENKNSAIYIFEFINFLRLRIRNNNIVEFNKFSDIEDYLRKQWSSLFQRLLFEQKFTKSESRRLEAFSEELKDIKTLILSNISSGQAKDVGRGVLKYRRLVHFLYSFNHPKIDNLILEKIPWMKLMQKLGVENVIITETSRVRPTLNFVKKDRTFYEARLSVSMFERFIDEWKGFEALNEAVKKEVLAALKEDFDPTAILFSMLKYRNLPFEDYIKDSNERRDERTISTTTTLSPTNIDIKQDLEYDE